MNFSPRAKQMYEQAFLGMQNLRAEIPKFYDFEYPFIPYTEKTLGQPMSSLKEEDPMKIGCMPLELIEVLSSAGGQRFNERDLEYLTIRKAYDQSRVSGMKRASQALTAVGVAGVGLASFMGANGNFAQGYVLAGPSTLALVSGLFGWLGAFETVPKRLREFAKLNRAAVEADNYLGNIDPIYLNKKLFQQ